MVSAPAEKTIRRRVRCLDLTGVGVRLWEESEREGDHGHWRFA
jgi:hypothetical protein